MRILVTGQNGQLGNSIRELVIAENYMGSDEFIFIGRDEMNLNLENDINRYFESNEYFDVIINCAAYTDVDGAESETKIADQINHLSVRRLATIAKEKKIRLIHISTDYVFDGESDEPYKETDMTNPINEYGRTKLAGEQAILNIMPFDGIVIRASWLYSEYGNNFLKTMLRLGQNENALNIVNDQIGSPTYANDLANAILEILTKKSFKEAGRKTQVYHYSNGGETSWYGFAKEIFKLNKIDCKVNGILSGEYPTPAKRPKNTVMNKDKIITAFGLHIDLWESSLKKSCLNKN